MTGVERAVRCRYEALQEQVHKQTYQVASLQKALQQANDQVEALKAAVRNSQDASMQKQVSGTQL